MKTKMKAKKKIYSRSSVAGVALLLFTNVAHADDSATKTDALTTASPAPESHERSHAVGVFSPIAGATMGSFFDVPVNRVSLGFEGGARWQKPGVTFLGGLRIEPGQTENGLGAHRLELSATVMGGRFLRFGGGLHGAYAMIVRRTQKDSFAEALFGNIGGFGIGAHAVLGLEVPLGSSPRSVELLARGVVETYGNSGNGWSLGPMLALRF